jgi:hypothetical protein
MIVLSLNIRGIGGALKTASFRRLLETTKPDLIFLQETLSTDLLSRDFVHRFRPSWFSAAASSIGNSGGLLVTWNPDLFELQPFLSCGGILLKGRFLATGQEVAFLNIYGPCTNKPFFWNKLANSGLLSLPNLILGGDLNFILKADEHWGGSFLPGPTDSSISELFTSHNLIDIQPPCLVPTWRNGRSGSEAIARRLDRFYVADSFLTSSNFSFLVGRIPFHFRSRPCFSQVDATGAPPSYSF